MEATVAVNFLLSYLYNKLPRRRVDMFGEMLEQLLQTNLEKYWLNQLNKTDPTFGVSVNHYVYSFHVGIGPNQIDSLINQVSAACLIDIYEILSYFPENLTLFIEPGKLQYCLNLSDSRIDIWRSDQRKYEVFELLKEGLLQQSPGFEPQQQQQQSQQPPPQQPIPESELIPSPEKLPLGITGNLPYSSTFGWQGPSATSQIVQVSSEGCFIQKSSSTPNFTAASFAQTKFGSTKLKSQLKRSSRISTYLAQQRSLAAVISPTGSGLPVGAGVTTISTTTTATTLVESIIKSSKTTSTGSPLSLSPFASSYFDSPTAMMSQRSISLSPCVKPQRGHSPPYSFNLPLILPPFTSSGPEIIGAPQFPISSTTQVMAPTIQITREDATPITFAITTIDEQFSWHKKSDF